MQVLEAEEGKRIKQHASARGRRR